MYSTKHCNIIFYIHLHKENVRTYVPNSRSSNLEPERRKRPTRATRTAIHVDREGLALCLEVGTRGRMEAKGMRVDGGREGGNDKEEIADNGKD